MSEQTKKVNIPNVLTIGRIWAIPLIACALYFQHSLIASWIAFEFWQIA